MTPDEMKALIEKTRRIDGMWSKEQIAAHANRLADALEAATTPMPDERLDEIEERAKCPSAVQAVTIGEYEACARALVEHDVPALIAEVRRLRAAHPAEETEWEYRRVTPAGNPRRDAIFESPPHLDEGWTMERRAVGPWSPVPTDGEGD